MNMIKYKLVDFCQKFTRNWINSFLFVLLSYKSYFRQICHLFFRAPQRVTHIRILLAVFFVIKFCQFPMRCLKRHPVEGSDRWNAPVSQRSWVQILHRPYFHYCLSSAHYCEDHFHSHNRGMENIFKPLRAGTIELSIIMRNSSFVF